jgi:hypothetical protein
LSELDRIVQSLSGHAYRFSCEQQLQDGVARVFGKVGIRFEREFVATREDRFDFLCEGGIVVEVKIDGSFSDCMRQVQRYSALEVTQGIVIAAAKLWGRTIEDGSQIGGKPLRLVRLRRQWL